MKSDYINKTIMTENTQNIALRLRIARTASGFKTSKDFAEMHAIALSTYCQHETGKRPLSIEQLFCYSELTGVEPVWLLTGNGNPCSNSANKQMEQTILQEQEKLGCSGELAVNAIPVISEQDRFSYVNMKVLKKIILESTPLIKEIPGEHLPIAVDFCFELYNRIITLEAKDEERMKVIKIGLKSFFEGLGMRDDGSKKNSWKQLAS